MLYKLEACKFHLSRMARSGKLKITDDGDLKTFDLPQDMLENLYYLSTKDLEAWSDFEQNLIEVLELKN